MLGGLFKSNHAFQARRLNLRLSFHLQIPEVPERNFRSAVKHSYQSPRGVESMSYAKFFYANEVEGIALPSPFSGLWAVGSKLL